MLILTSGTSKAPVSYDSYLFHLFILVSMHTLAHTMKKKLNLLIFFCSRHTRGYVNTIAYPRQLFLKLRGVTDLTLSCRMT